MPFEKKSLNHEHFKSINSLPKNLQKLKPFQTLYFVNIDLKLK